MSSAWIISGAVLEKLQDRKASAEERIIMRIVVLCGYPLGEVRNGAAMYIDRLTCHVSRIEGIELHVIVCSEKNRKLAKDNLTIHEVRRVFPATLCIPLAAWFLKRKIMEINPDIVHVLGTWYPYSTCVPFIRNAWPVVLTAFGLIAKERHYDYEPGIIDYVVGLIAELNEKYVLSNTPNIIVESSYNKDIISKMVNSKVYIVPDGIEWQLIYKIRPDPNKKLDIFFVGLLESRKGADLLIKALPIILDSLPSLTIHVAGTGPQEGELKDLVSSMDLESHVKFLGFISEEEKFQYYKACKVVAVPSRWDFSPITIYEAMACGKPVVASNSTNSEILEDGKTGLLFDSENTKDLAGKIVTLLRDNELRERMGKAASEKARECDWSKIAERTVEIYKELISNFHRR